MSQARKPFTDYIAIIKKVLKSCLPYTKQDVDIITKRIKDKDNKF